MRTPSNRARIGIWLIAAAPLASAACSDSMRIYTDTSSSGAGAGGASGETSTTATSGGGGDATATTGAGGGVCGSNADCPSAAEPAYQSICDTYYHRCVECLVPSDCAGKPGTICSNGACICPTEGDTYCADPPRCVDTKTSIADCGECRHACYASCGDSKCSDAWEPISTDGAPTGRAYHVAVWTDAHELLVWGGETNAGYTNTGGIYDPAARKWRTMATFGAPSPRAYAAGVWTTGPSPRFLVFGGRDASGALATGGKYDPATDTWYPMATGGAPSPRAHHAAVWTGTEMLVWGGEDAGGNRLADGARYAPGTDAAGSDAWTAMSGVFADTGEALPARSGHTGLWADARLYVFGGVDASGTYQGTLQSYNPLNDQWGAISVELAPSPRAEHTAVWTGTQMIAWGGFDGSSPLGDGAYYANGGWTVMAPKPAAVSPRSHHTAVWMPSIGKMVVWGGLQGGTYLDGGGLFDPGTNTWVDKPMPVGPSARAYHTAVVTDQDEMLVWGGVTVNGYTSTGALFTPEP